jgi:hypothetical protein
MFESNDMKREDAEEDQRDEDAMSFSTVSGSGISLFRKIVRKNNNNNNNSSNVDDKSSSTEVDAVRPPECPDGAAAAFRRAVLIGRLVGQQQEGDDASHAVVSPAIPASTRSSLSLSTVSGSGVLFLRNYLKKKKEKHNGHAVNFNRAAEPFHLRLNGADVAGARTSVATTIADLLLSDLDEEESELLALDWDVDDVCFCLADQHDGMLDDQDVVTQAAPNVSLATVDDANKQFVFEEDQLAARDKGLARGQQQGAINLPQESNFHFLLSKDSGGGCSSQSLKEEEEKEEAILKTVQKLSPQQPPPPPPPLMSMAPPPLVSPPPFQLMGGPRSAFTRPSVLAAVAPTTSTPPVTSGLSHSPAATLMAAEDDNLTNEDSGGDGDTERYSPYSFHGESDQDFMKDFKEDEENPAESATDGSSSTLGKSRLSNMLWRELN